MHGERLDPSIDRLLEGARIDPSKDRLKDPLKEPHRSFPLLGTPQIPFEPDMHVESQTP